MDAKPLPPTLRQVKASIRKLLDLGVPAHTVHDFFISASDEHCNAYQRAQAEFANLRRECAEVRLGVVTRFMSGVGTFAARRVTGDFRQFLEAP
jgi:hypothetical protein